MGNSGRRLIFMLTAEGKSKEELAHEAWEAIQKHREAKKQGRLDEWQPVLDLNPNVDG